MADVIGERLFVNDVSRPVYLDESRQQFVVGHDHERVHGVWLLTPEVLDDTPVVVMAGGFVAGAGDDGGG
jgi:hypothetical protein